MNLVFAGTPPFAATHLRALLASSHTVNSVITQPDKPGKRGKRTVPSAVKQVAEEANLQVIQPGRLRASDLAEFEPDLLVVVAYGQILKSDVLALPRFGCINVHASLLPRWRGAAPIQRAIAAGDQATGVCIMQMDAGLDTGDVYTRQAVTIANEDSAATLTEKLALAGCKSLVETLDEIAAGRAIASPQGEQGVTYAHKVTKEEARLDFEQPALVLARRVRAFNPDPVAYAFLGDLRMRIWEAEAVGERAEGARSANQADVQPGLIVAADNTGISIACGKGVLKVKRLQLPVGKGTVLSAADILNARRELLSPGQRLT